MNPEGRLFVYQATVINGAAIATPTVTLTPGRGNEFELMYGAISHNDATASHIDVDIRDDDDRVLLVLADLDNVTQNSVNYFPAPGTAVAVGGNVPSVPHPIFISGLMDLYMAAVDIDATEGITAVIVGRLYGGMPTVVETGGGTPTITVNTEQVF